MGVSESERALARESISAVASASSTKTGGLHRDLGPRYSGRRDRHTGSGSQTVHLTIIDQQLRAGGPVPYGTQTFPSNGTVHGRGQPRYLKDTCHNVSDGWLASTAQGEQLSPARTATKGRPRYGRGADGASTMPEVLLRVWLKRH